jgi:Glycosyltransferase family 87
MPEKRPPRDLLPSVITLLIALVLTLAIAPSISVITTPIFLHVPAILGGADVWKAPNLDFKSSLFLITPLVLLSFHYRQHFGIRWRAALMGFFLGLILRYSHLMLVTMTDNIANLPEWDFKWFWIYGRVAVERLNFVDPQNARKIAQTLNPGADLLNELDFTYLPPTIFLFAWLGFFKVQTAHLLWYAVHSLILLLDIGLLWKIFGDRDQGQSLALIATLVFILEGTWSTFFFAQTHFTALLFALLFWLNRDRLQGGFWLGLGTLVKPFIGLLVLYPLLQRFWKRVMLGMILMLVAAFILTGIIFGMEPLVDYFSTSPGANRPKAVFVETMNQSLLAIVLRLTDYDYSQTSPLTSPVFIGLSLAIIGITAGFIYRLGRYYPELVFAMTYSMSLLLYPGTLSHYSFHLIVSILFLWKYREHLGLGIWGTTAFITMQYVLTSYGGLSFVAFLSNWLLLAGIAVVQSHKVETLAYHGDR